MKKKLKGLIALVMAIAMIVPMTTHAFGAVTLEEWEKLNNNTYMRAVVNPDVSIGEKAVNGGFNASDYNYFHTDLVYVGEKAIDELWSEPDFYNIVGWTIWEVQTSGYVMPDSKSKTVPRDYTVTAEDFREFALMDSSDSAYAPYIEAILEPKDFVIDVYNAEGTTKTGEVSINIENYMTKSLSVPEGYVGYMLYADSDWVGDGIQSSFVADGEDLWTELLIMSSFEYEPIKLVPVKKMPYYINIGGYVGGWEIEQAQVIYLAPGEKIMDNEYVASNIKHTTAYTQEEIDWNVWIINYCGSTSSTPLDDYENDSYFTTTTGLSVEDYTKTRSEIYNDGYSETFYYKTNFPVLGTYDYYEYIDYSIPVYDKDDNFLYDIEIDKGDLKYFDWDKEEYVSTSIFEVIECYQDELPEDTCFAFEYDGVDCVEVTNIKDIWDIAIEDCNYNYDKAKLKIVCSAHDYQKDSVAVQPTVNNKGKTKYVCSVCGTTKIVEDIDKLVAIDSIVLKGSQFTYTGSNIIPGFDVKAKVNGTLVTLTKDVDYIVSYSNNKNPGLATVTVKGKGKYAGTKTAQFTIKPAKVNNLKAEPGIEQITLSWDAVVGATGYAVFAAAEEGDYEYIGTTSKTSFVAAGLPNGTEYNYKVAAYVKTSKGNVFGDASIDIRDGAKIELKSVKLSRNSFTYTGEYIKPAVTVTAYDVTGREVTLTNNTDYKVEYKNFKNPGIATVTITGKGNYYGTLTTTFTITPNWVKNVNQVVNSTYTKNLRITWDKVENITGYEVYMSDAKDGKFVKVGTVAASSNQYVSKDLQPGTKYYYKVRAYKVSGNKTVYGNFSNVTMAVTRTLAPEGVRYDAKTAKLAWYVSKGSAGYEVYYTTNSKFLGSKLGETSYANRSLGVSSLEKGKTYYVRVRSYVKTTTGQKIYGAFSEQLKFTR